MNDVRAASESGLFVIHTSSEFPPNSDSTQWPIMSDTCAYLNYRAALNNRKKGVKIPPIIDYIMFFVIGFRDKKL